MKRPLIAAVVLMAGFSLAACGDDSVPPGTATEGDDTSTVPDDMTDMGHQGEENAPMAPGARDIEVTATSFAFDPDEIRIDAGEDVAIVLTAEDELHDFNIEDADGHVAADEGETASGGLRIDEPGTYTFYCSVEGHREGGMEGTLIVE